MTYRSRTTAIALAAIIAALLACKGSKPKAGASCKMEGDNNCQDPQTHLVCRGGTWAAFPCKGPKGCTVKDNLVECDATFAEVGAACDDRGNGACGLDKKSYLVCKDAKWQLSSGCLGPKGCTVNDKGAVYDVQCDESIAKEGGPCDTPSDVACSEDKKSQLTCTSSQWKKQQDCAKGCTATPDGETYTINCDSGE